MNELINKNTYYQWKHEHGFSYTVIVQSPAAGTEKKFIELGIYYTRSEDVYDILGKRYRFDRDTNTLVYIETLVTEEAAKKHLKSLREKLAHTRFIVCGDCHDCFIALRDAASRPMELHISDHTKLESLFKLDAFGYITEMRDKPLLEEYLQGSSLWSRLEKWFDEHHP